MAVNLLRNARVFVTTDVDATTGVVDTGALESTKTWEIQVLDGLSFSQNTTTDTVTLNEAGATPNRGQRQFNTALEPVDFSMSTYIRPNGVPTNVTCEEEPLWKLFTNNGITSAPGTTSFGFASSNSHTLPKAGLIVLLDSVAFVIDNIALDTATIDFGLDAIATIAWAGKGTALRRLESVTISGTTFSGGIVGTFTAKNTSAPYLANKLSTSTVYGALNYGGTAYTIALTGGSITFANNLSYLTPANLGVVNQPIAYFTGTRAISGNVTAYLRSGGTNDTSDLMNALLSATTDVDPAYSFKVSIGGASATTRVDISCPAIVPSIPSVSTDQVVSTQINFTAQGYTGTDFDIEAVNEATIAYVAP